MTRRTTCLRRSPAAQGRRGRAAGRGERYASQFGACCDLPPEWHVAPAPVVVHPVLAARAHDQAAPEVFPPRLPPRRIRYAMPASLEAYRRGVPLTRRQRLEHDELMSEAKEAADDR